MKYRTIDIVFIICLIAFSFANCKKKFNLWKIPAAAPRPSGSGILGGQLFSNGNVVTVTVLPASAGYSSDIYYQFGNGPRSRIANAKANVNQSFNIPPSARGTEIIFSIFVHNTRQSFYSGPASRNPDRIAHAYLTRIGNGVYRLGFEDLFGGGDRDYDDVLIQVANVSHTQSSAPTPVLVRRPYPIPVRSTYPIPVRRPTPVPVRRPYPTSAPKPILKPGIFKPIQKPVPAPKPISVAIPKPAPAPITVPVQRPSSVPVQRLTPVVAPKPASGKSPTPIHTKVSVQKQAPIKVPESTKPKDDVCE